MALLSGINTHKNEIKGNGFEALKLYRVRGKWCLVWYLTSIHLKHQKCNQIYSYLRLYTSSLAKKHYWIHSWLSLLYPQKSDSCTYYNM